MSDPKDISTAPGAADLDTEDRDRSSGGEEPRVGDLLAGRVSQEELDPETVAQLAAWFGAPLPAGAAPPELEGAADPRDEARERRARALDAVDPTFLAALESKWTQGERLLRVTAPLTPARPAPSKFDLARWDVRLGDEVRETERPEDIVDALKEPTPQAILRDLHRPEQQWPLRMLPKDLGMDIAGLDSRARLESALRAPLAVRMDDEPVPARMISEDMSALRARLDEPWGDSYIPPEKRRGPDSYVPTAEDLKWFGMVGFDPDL